MAINKFKDLPSTSMVNLFPEIIYDKDQVPTKSLDIWNSFRFVILPVILSNRAYFLYTVKPRDTLEGIAGKFYNDQRLWWITLILNDAEDPFDFLSNVLDNSDNENSLSKIKILKSSFIPVILSELKKVKGFTENLTDNNRQEDN